MPNPQPQASGAPLSSGSRSTLKLAFGRSPTTPTMSAQPSSVALTTWPSTPTVRSFGESVEQHLDLLRKSVVDCHAQDVYRLQLEIERLEAELMNMQRHLVFGARTPSSESVKVPGQLTRAGGARALWPMPVKVCADDVPACDVPSPWGSETLVWGARTPPHIQEDQPSQPVSPEPPPTRLNAGATASGSSEKVGPRAASYETPPFPRPSSRVSRHSVAASYHPHSRELFVAREVWRQETSSNTAIPQLIKKKRISRQGKHLKIETNDSAGRWPMFLPYSTFQVTWSSIGLFIFIYDMMIIPVRVAFDVETSGALTKVDWVTLLFWIADVLMTCRRGVYIKDKLVMGTSEILWWYVRTWLFIDVALVLMDLWILIFENYKLVESLTLLRMVRGLRLVRLLRMAKVAKVLLDPFKEYTIHLQRHFHSRIVTIIVFFIFVLHFMSCAWYEIGDDDGGWVKQLPAGQDIFHRYLTSLHWAAAILHGDALIEPTTTKEFLFEIPALLIGFYLFALFLQAMVQTSGNRLGERTSFMNEACTSYLQRRQISQPLARRVRKWLRAHILREDFSEQMALERQLLAVLPDSLQGDLYLEARGSTLHTLQFFCDLYMLAPRCVRSLCHRAMSDKSALTDEIIFDNGDPCSSMYFIDYGRLWYGLDGENPPHRDTQFSIVSDTSERQSVGFGGSAVLLPGKCLSEAVLWTTWNHCGRLQCDTESQLLVLDSAMFAHVIDEEANEALLHAAKYCRVFVLRLNELTAEAPQSRSDIMSLYQESDDLDQALEAPTNDFHYIFLSHYKVEAGTEAALMREVLDRVVRTDLPAIPRMFLDPVFLDSENLQDLNNIRLHVQNSNNLLLLLTPGVLSRPWCLVEIVLAHRSDSQIVPVEVQRPGASFVYPTEEYFARLGRGEVLNAEAEHLLASEGIGLVDLVQALRRTFTQVALPFSPHKSTAIREAELREILKRCVLPEGTKDTSFLDTTPSDPTKAGPTSSMVSSLSSQLRPLRNIMNRTVSQ